MSKILELLHGLTFKKPKMVLTICLIVSLIMGFLAKDLRLEMSWSGLVPKGDESVKAYNEIMENFPSMNNIFVIVSAENEKDLINALKKAEKTLLENEKYVKSVFTSVDSDFLLDNMLMLGSNEEIEIAASYFLDPNLNGYFSNLTVIMESLEELKESDLKDSSEEIDMMMKGIEISIRDLNEFLIGEREDIDIQKLVSGDTYTRSKDGKKILMSIRPSFGIMDYEKLVPGVNNIIDSLKSIENDIKGAKFEVTGMHVVAKDEIQSTEADTVVTMLIGVVGIIILMLLAFRMKSAPIIATVPLLVGVIWTIGLTAIFIGRLNMMTAFTAVMLMGLGIDFSIHLLSSFTEQKSEGKTLEEASKVAVINTGQGIFSGALTTAVAFFTLSISNLELLRELGIVMGTGILCTVFAVFLILPSIFSLVYRKKEPKKCKSNYIILGKIAGTSSKLSMYVIIAVILVSGFMVNQGFKNSFNLNVLDMEPKGLESVEYLNKLIDDFGMSNDAVMVLKDDLDEVKELTEELREEKLVSHVMSITDFIPDEEVQKKNQKAINNYKQFLSNVSPIYNVDREQLKKDLEDIAKSMNKINGDLYGDSIRAMIEIIDSEELIDKRLNKLNSEFYMQMNSLKARIFNGDMITIDDIPEDIKSQFVSSDGEKYMISVFPSFDIWEEIGDDKGKEFLDMVREKDSKFTGTPIFMRVLFDSASKEVLKTIILVAVGLLLILLIHFKSIKDTLIIFIPLIFTLGITIGIMKLLGIQWNIMNVLAVPLIIGIGIDDGIHVMHRIRENDEPLQKTFSNVGRAILITTLTTMIGFGSLMFSAYRGISYFGTVIFIGVGVAFIMTILIIPVFVKKDVIVNDNTKFID